MKTSEIKTEGTFKVDDLTIFTTYTSEYKPSGIGVNIYKRKDTDHAYFDRANSSVDLMEELGDIEVEPLDREKDLIPHYDYFSITSFRYNDNNEYVDDNIKLSPKEFETLKMAQDKKSTKIIRRFGYYQMYQIIVVKGVLSLRKIKTDNKNEILFEKPIKIGKNRLEFDYNEKESHCENGEVFYTDDPKHMIFLLNLTVQEKSSIVDINKNVLNIGDKVAVADYQNKNMFVAEIVKLTDKRVTVSLNDIEHAYRYDQVCKI